MKLSITQWWSPGRLNQSVSTFTVSASKIGRQWMCSFNMIGICAGLITTLVMCVVFQNVLEKSWDKLLSFIVYTSVYAWTHTHTHKKKYKPWKHALFTINSVSFLAQSRSCYWASLLTLLALALSSLPSSRVPCPDPSGCRCMVPSNLGEPSASLVMLVVLRKIVWSYGRAIHRVIAVLHVLAFVSWIPSNTAARWTLLFLGVSPIQSRFYMEYAFAIADLVPRTLVPLSDRPVSIIVTSPASTATGTSNRCKRQRQTTNANDRCKRQQTMDANCKWKRQMGITDANHRMTTRSRTSTNTRASQKRHAHDACKWQTQMSRSNSRCLPPSPPVLQLLLGRVHSPSQI